MIKTVVIFVMKENVFQTVVRGGGKVRVKMVRSEAVEQREVRL